MTYDEILYDVADRVATITLNRPDRLNAWTARMGEEFREAIRVAADHEGVRAIVITGAGRGFCPGVDVQQLDTAAGRAVPRPAPSNLSDDEIDRLHSFNYLMRVEKPVIAGINGGIAGVGLGVALCCDLRFMAAGAKLTTAFARRGLIAEYGSAWLLPRMIGAMNAADLLLSGRTIVTEEAERMGLVRQLPVEGFRERVQAEAAMLANSCSPRSMAIIKRQLLAAHDQTLSEATHSAVLETYRSHASEDFKEGVAHYLERRPPAFTGR